MGLTRPAHLQNPVFPAAKAAENPNSMKGSITKKTHMLAKSYKNDSSQTIRLIKI